MIQKKLLYQTILKHYVKVWIYLLPNMSFYWGDFNAGMERSSTNTFCSNYNLTSTINKSACYKNPGKPTYIDLILTNCPGSFQNSCAIETDLSDFHKNDCHGNKNILSEN